MTLLEQLQKAEVDLANAQKDKANAATLNTACYQSFKNGGAIENCLTGKTPEGDGKPNYYVLNKQADEDINAATNSINSLKLAIANDPASQADLARVKNTNTWLLLGVVVIIIVGIFLYKKYA